MGLLVRDDDYDESRRMTGFNRYKQLLSFYAGHWTKLSLILFASALPLMIGIYISLKTTSLLLLLPLCVLGGAICGPFLAGLVDSIQRGLRDDYNNRWENYKKALKQNWKESLLPGSFWGLVLGSYSFFLYLAIYTEYLPLTLWSKLLFLLAALLLLNFENLFWPQLVLFQQSFQVTFFNVILFSCKYLWRILGIALLELVILGCLFILLPYSLILVAAGIWYYIFLSQFLLYDKLNLEFKIEERFPNCLS